MAQKRKRKKTNIMKWVVRAFLLALFIAAVVIVFLVWDNYFNDKKDNNPKASEESSEIEEKKVEESEDEEEKEEEMPVEKKEVKQYEGENPNVSNDLTGAITYAGVSNGTLRIRVNIDQYLSGGTCELGLITDGGKVYSTSVGVSDSASTATCQGFDVPTSGLPTGDYRIEVIVSSGDKTGIILGEVKL